MFRVQSRKGSEYGGDLITILGKIRSLKNYSEHGVIHNNYGQVQNRRFHYTKFESGMVWEYTLHY